MAPQFTVVASNGMRITMGEAKARRLVAAADDERAYLETYPLDGSTPDRRQRAAERRALRFALVWCSPLA